MKTLLNLTGALLLGAVPLSATAQGLDGDGPMLCAATTAAVCEQNKSCVQGSPEAVNLPVFLWVDPAAKSVKSKRGGGEMRSSSVSTVVAGGGKLVLQGSDDGFGWTVTIDQASGKMTFTGGGDVGYVVFGNCTAL